MRCPCAYAAPVPTVPLVPLVPARYALVRALHLVVPALFLCLC